MGEIIELFFIKSRQTFGALRVHDPLIRKGFSDYSVKQVRRIMRQKGLFSVHCRQKRKMVRTTDSGGNHPIAENVLCRDFGAAAPNLKWVGDLTYIWTGEGWMYVETVLDLYSRKIVGYALGNNIDVALACKAFRIAPMRRPQARELAYHSDIGSVYGSVAFRELLIAHQVTPSWSHKGDFYYNAVADSFFHTLKVELTHRNEYKFKIAAIHSIAEYIEDFYNSERTHSTLPLYPGYFS